MSSLECSSCVLRAGATSPGHNLGPRLHGENNAQCTPGVGPSLRTKLIPCAMNPEYSKKKERPDLSSGEPGLTFFAVSKTRVFPEKKGVFLGSTRVEQLLRPYFCSFFEIHFYAPPLSGGDWI